MTIGIVLDDSLDKSDGVQQAVLSIGTELSDRGHEVHYIVSDTERTDIPNIHSMGKSLNFKFNGNSVRTPLPVSTKKINKLYKDINFDILHVQMPYSPFFAAKVLKHAPDNVVKFGTFHILPYGFASKVGTRIIGLVLKKSLKSLSTCFAVSKPSLKFMESSFKLRGSVLPNPVNYGFYRSFSKSEKNKLSLVYIGRFEERKGVKKLVEAYRLVDTDLRNKTKLTMCGKGPLLEEVKNLSKNYGLDIAFPGFVSESQKAQYLADADVAVFPSKAGESFGIVLTEAMSAGAGVTIGGNNPGYASVLRDWNETLFDPTDLNEFANILSLMLTDKKLRSRIGKSQNEKVKEYDINNIVTKLENKYRKSLSLRKQVRK